MRIEVVVAIALITAMAATGIADAMSVRNDQKYPSENNTIDYEELFKILSKLKKLNDTVINNYLEEIENAVEERNYEKAYEIIQSLTSYVERRYGNETLSPELVESLIVSGSIMGLGEEGAVIDLDKYMELIDRFGSKTLEKTAGDREFEGIISKLGKIMKYPQSMGGGVEKIRDTGRKYNVFAPLTPLTGGLHVNPLYLIPFAAVLALIAMYRFRDRLSFLARGLDRFKYRARELMYRTALMLKPSMWSKDPVVKLYNYWYLHAKLRGFERNDWETLREFLHRVRNDLLKNYGVEVTSLYEERIYGLREVDRARVEKLRHDLRRLFGGTS